MTKTEMPERNTCDTCGGPVTQNAHGEVWHRTDLARAEVAAAYRDAGYIACNACLVPPDGGSPTEDEVAVCDEAMWQIHARIPDDARAALDAQLAEAEARGRRKALEEAAHLVDVRAAAYHHEHGYYDPDTGVTHYPGDGLGWMGEWQDISEEIRAIPDAPAREQHPDDLAVDRFAVTMKAKLAKKRADGRGGWQDKDDCSQRFLSDLLRGHVDKGDPVDVANFAMMLHQRGEEIAPAREVTVQEAARVLLALAETRTLPAYLVDMPIDKDGNGPAEIGKDATDIAFQVWRASDLRVISQRQLLSSAVVSWLRALAQGGQDDG